VLERLTSPPSRCECNAKNLCVFADAQIGVCGLLPC
jgi:hypothetical protein